MKIEVFTEGMNNHDRARNALGQMKDDTLVVDQAAAGNAAELLQQGAIIAKVRAQHFGDAKRIVVVRNGKEDRLNHQRAERDNATAARPSAFASGISGQP